MSVQSQSHCLPYLFGHIYGLLSGTTWCRHPLNCEPPLSMLMDKGFITPVSIHYVRNHGAVPRLDWDTHKVKVCTAFHPACTMHSCCEPSGIQASHKLWGSATVSSHLWDSAAHEAPAGD